MSADMKGRCDDQVAPGRRSGSMVGPWPIDSKDDVTDGKKNGYASRMADVSRILPTDSRKSILNSNRGFSY